MTGIALAPATAKLVKDFYVADRLAHPAGTLLAGEAFSTQDDDRAQVVFTAIVKDGKTVQFEGWALQQGEAGVRGKVVRKASRLGRPRLIRHRPVAEAGRPRRLDRVDQVWPDGLGPLIEHVRASGMSFGLWFEPEMVNPDSELYRAHPDWVLAVPGPAGAAAPQPAGARPGPARGTRAAVRPVDALLREYPIDFVKWDHNRPLIDGGSAARDGAPGVHAQTLGFYGLLDRLRAAHPDVEWESCASGGARIDLACWSGPSGYGPRT